DRRLQALAAASTSAPFMRAARRQAPPVVVRRPVGRPLVVEAVTLPRLITPLSSKASALVIVTDLDAPSRTPGALLARMFGLTPAEVRLCEALMQGLSVREAAERIGITEQTARQRLKIIFQKTDTNRQSELMLLLAKL
ncbi:helix-turn-helix transcriptional regulator, partial [Nitratireductor pacificus]